MDFLTVFQNSFFSKIMLFIYILTSYSSPIFVKCELFLLLNTPPICAWVTKRLRNFDWQLIYNIEININLLNPLCTQDIR